MLSPNRNANADFASTPADRIRNQAVESDQRHTESEKAHRAHQVYDQMHRLETLRPKIFAHGAHVVDGLTGVHGAHQIAERFDKRGGVARGFDQQCHPRQRLLGDRQIEERQTRLAEGQIRGVFRHTDYLNPRGIAAQAAKAFPDRILMRPIGFGHELVDHGDVRCCVPVGGLDGTATHHRGADRFEVMFVHYVAKHGIALLALWELIPLGRDIVTCNGRAIEGDGLCQSRAFDARQLACAFGQSSKEVARLFRRIVHQRGIKRHHHQVIGAETGIRSHHGTKGLDEKGGGREQHQR